MSKSNVPKKLKTTLYLSEADEILLNEVFIKRLKERNKTDRSALLCEGLRLLYQQECLSCVEAQA